MINKLIFMGIIILAITISVSFLINYSNNTDSENKTTNLSDPDIIMPTKVSRPGCEKTSVCYIPTQITIHAGEKVTWQNQDSAFHSVTSGQYASSNGLFDSGYLDPDEFFSYTFSESGTYDYHCTLHPWMKGQIIVE